MVLLPCLFGGQQVYAVHTAKNNAEKHRQQRILPAQEQPGGCHQLDVAAAERAVDDKAEQKHRHTDAERTDDVRQPVGRGEQHAHRAADRQRQIQPVRDSLRLCINERNAQQDPADRQRQQRGPAHAEQPARQGVGSAVPPSAAQRQHAAQKLHQQVPRRNVRTAVAAPPAQE